MRVIDPVIDALVHWTGRLMLARYLFASACALSSDFAVFLAFGSAGAGPMWAAFCGYAVGLAIHWMVSTRFVFDVGTGASHMQRAGFVMSALVGMGITMASVGTLSALGIVPALAKLASVPASFFTVYAIRKYGVFGRV